VQLIRVIIMIEGLRNHETIDVAHQIACVDFGVWCHNRIPELAFFADRDLIAPSRDKNLALAVRGDLLI